jgi:hypothetical protein
MCRRSGTAPADAELRELASIASQVGGQPGIPRSAPRARIRRAIFVDERSLWRIHFDAYPQGPFFSEVLMLSRRSINSHTEHDLFIRLFLTGGGGW